MKLQDYKNIVIVHDSLLQFGGAERVTKAFLEIFPTASFYTLAANSETTKLVTPIKPETSFLQILINLGVPFKYLLFLIPFAVATLKIPENSFILSSSSLFLKALRIPKNSVHVEYLHTPPRFIWTDPDYIDQEVPYLFRSLVKFLLGLMKKWDKKMSHRPSLLIANSEEVKNRIKQFYQLESPVIFPFVDTNFWKPTRPKQDYFLMGGRLQAHKHYEDIIRALNNTPIKLVVCGVGRQSEFLKKISSKNITFTGKVSDEELRDLYSGALGFIYPSIEDAGIMPLEAAACGTATLAINKGGSKETVKTGITGEFFTQYDPQEIYEKVLSWNSGKYQTSNLRQHAEQFSRNQFEKKLQDLITNTSINK